jgi:hypothetical protein
MTSRPEPFDLARLSPNDSVLIRELRDEELLIKQELPPTARPYHTFQPARAASAAE